MAATGFLGLFSIVGIMFYGSAFFFDFWVKEFNWTRATVTSGSIFGKLLLAHYSDLQQAGSSTVSRPRKLLVTGILISGCAVIGLSQMNSSGNFIHCTAWMALGFVCGGPLPNQILTSRWFDKSRGKAMGVAYLRHWHRRNACSPYFKMVKYADGLALCRW